MCACAFALACCGRAGACFAGAALCVFAFAAVFVAARTFAPLEWDAGVLRAGAFLACLRAVLLKMGASVQGELKKERNYSMQGSAGVLPIWLKPAGWTAPSCV